MRRWITSLVIVGAVALIAMPAAFIVTLVLYPFWSWIEASYSIESVGHSGPANWCFTVVYGVFLAAALPLLWRRRRHRDGPEWVAR